MKRTATLRQNQLNMIDISVKSSLDYTYLVSCALSILMNGEKLNLKNFKETLSNKLYFYGVYSLEFPELDYSDIQYIPKAEDFVKKNFKGFKDKDFEIVEKILSSLSKG
jgi:hypothetical protein